MTNQLELTGLEREWLAEAEQAVMQHIPFGKRFTSDELHSLLPVPEHPNWMGVLVARLKDRRLIAEDGRLKSNRKEANGRKITAWRMIG